MAVSPEAEYVHSCESIANPLSCYIMNKHMCHLHRDDKIFCTLRYCKCNRSTCAVWDSLNKTLNTSYKPCLPCKNNFISDFCDVRIWKQIMTFVDMVIMWESWTFPPRIDESTNGNLEILRVFSHSNNFSVFGFHEPSEIWIFLPVCK